MSLKVHKFKDFGTTHENKFFRQIAQEMKRAFCDYGTSFLLGNLSCAGRYIDAVFITSGKIIVLEFKNYGGTLTFSENAPWKIIPSDTQQMRFVEVQGGGKEGRNPLGQVGAYRYALKDVLEVHREVIRKNDRLLNFGHIAGLVIFHSKVKLSNPEAIHAPLKYWFDIADPTDYIDKIRDQSGTGLDLTDQEVESIAKVLGVDETVSEFHLDTDTDLDEIKSSPVSESLILVDRALREFERYSEADSPQEVKMLDYFRASTFLERLKEDLKATTRKKDIGGGRYLFDFALDRDKTLFSLLLPKNEQFFKEYLLQKNESRFGKPKLLFVGLQIQIGTGDDAFVEALLYKTITLTDKINDSLPIDIACEELELYRYPLEQKELSATLLDEMELEVGAVSTLEEKVDVLSRHLEMSVAVGKKITVSFIEETPYTKGLESELRKLAQRNPNNTIAINQSILATSFLKRTEYKRPPDKITTKEDLIFVTDTNEEQKQAVESSFQQPITIVTGPPGTGKTQVITNIMANAVFQNQTVLLASKNSTAVESAITRISNVLKEKDFLLYFNSVNGTRNQLNSLMRIHNKSRNNGFAYDTQALAKMRERIEGKQDTQKRVLETQTAIETLKNNIEAQKAEMQHIETECENHSRDNRETLDFWSRYNEKMDKVITLFQNELLYIQKYRNLPDWFFKCFLEGKRIQRFETWLSALLPEPDRQQLGIPRNPKTTRLNVWITESLGLIKESQQVYQKAKKLEGLFSMHREKILRLQERVSTLELEDAELKKQIEELKTIEFGQRYLNLTITERLNQADQKIISSSINMCNENTTSPSQIKDMLTIFNIVATKTLSVRNAFPLIPELFDILIFDEASQCDFISALPLLFRAKRIVIIGDPFQLKHITSIKPHEEKYIKYKLELSESVSHVSQSLFDYCEQFSSICGVRHNIFLAKHYRCHKSIVGYSSKAFYEKRAGQTLQILTTDDDKTHGIFWENVNDGVHDNERNINQAEVAKIKMLVKRYLDSTNYSIGVTTPFRGQKDALLDAIPPNDRVQIGTVHAFQGAEQDVMILSLVCTNNSKPRKIEWINESVPFLLNVAVTRAKNILHVVGDAGYFRRSEQNMPLHELVRYVDCLAS